MRASLAATTLSRNCTILLADHLIYRAVSISSAIYDQVSFRKFEFSNDSSFIHNVGETEITHLCCVIVLACARYMTGQAMYVNINLSRIS